MISPSRSEWEAYEFATGLTLGFHGCDKALGEAILASENAHLLPSENAYDWLGSGIYFWEGNPQRAYEFALERAQGGANSRGKIETPFVVGAILELRRNLTLASSDALHQVKESYVTIFCKKRRRTASKLCPLTAPVCGRATSTALFSTRSIAGAGRPVCPPTTACAVCFGRARNSTPAPECARPITSKFAFATPPACWAIFARSAAPELSETKAGNSFALLLSGVTQLGLGPLPSPPPITGEGATLRRVGLFGTDLKRLKAVVKRYSD